MVATQFTSTASIPTYPSSLNPSIALAESRSPHGIPASYFIVVRTIGGLLDARVFALIADLHAHHRIHIEPGELPRLDDRDAHLVVLRLQGAVPGVAGL